MNHFVKKLVFIVICFLFCSKLLGDNIGQRFILSCPKTDNKKSLTSWLEQTKPAGVILEAWHMSDRVKAKKFIQTLQDIAQEIGIPQLLISIDWEGGIVSRANEAGGFVSVPAPYKLSKAGRSACWSAGALIGNQLHAIGVNIDFSPSLDLFDPNNYVLGTRCFSEDPEQVLACGLAFSKGLQSEGVLPVIKHFPGLGLGNCDTHLTQVKIDFDEQAFGKHIAPFINGLDAGLPAIMVSHALCSNFGNKPSSQLKSVVDFLKNHNPNVLLITDDISMKGFNNNSDSFVDDVKCSLNTGFDFSIYSATPDRQIKLMQALADFDIEDKAPFCAPQSTGKSDFNQEALGMRLARDVNKQCPYVGDLTQQKVLMLTVNLPKIRPGEDWFINQKNSYVGAILKKHIKSFVEVFPESLEQVDKLVKEIKSNKYDVVFMQTFFYGQGAWNTNQEAWLKKLASCAKKIVVLSLGHPYEQKILGKQARIMELGAFHKPELDIACQRLLTTNLSTGADKLIKNIGHFLKNKKFALLCHNCSYVVRNGKEYFLPDVLLQWVNGQKDKTSFVALFSPEHGLLGGHGAGIHVASKKVSKWGCPVYSLHGDLREPTDQMLKDIDILLIDLQEVGVRCFTYLSTMVLALEAAAKNDIEVIVLDRPNPLKFWGAQGPNLEASCESFLGKLNIQFIHGKTMGSLAKLANKQYHAKLIVLGCTGDDKNYFETNFKKPSPNIMSLETLFVYPITVFLEGTNYSEGRGTINPFQQIGAPWVDGHKLAKILNKKKLTGVYFEPIEFMPINILGVAENPKHKNKKCGGVFIHILDRDNIYSVKIGRILLETLFKLYPEQSKFILSGKRYMLDLLVGNSLWREKIRPFYT